MHSYALSVEASALSAEASALSAEACAARQFNGPAQARTLAVLFPAAASRSAAAGLAGPLLDVGYTYARTEWKRQTAAMFHAFPAPW